jgi:hypothetical protein
MVTRTWKVVQKPSDLKTEREKWLSMERVINVELRRVNPAYGIKNLVRRHDGSFDFEATMEFHKKDRDEVRRIFRLLEQQDVDFVQAKFYLPRAIQKRVKLSAIDLGVPVSSLVAAILDEYSRESADQD